MNQKKLFNQFLGFFPEVQLPVTLTEESHHVFEQKNVAFPEEAIELFLKPLHEKRESDEELVEYIPCLRIPDTYDMHAVIYWRAQLLEYEYFLMTFDKEGKAVDHRRIAGLFTDKERILRMVTTIDPDWIIYIVVGEADARDRSYDPRTSRSYNLELLADGKIIETQLNHE